MYNIPVAFAKEPSEFKPESPIRKFDHILSNDSVGALSPISKQEYVTYLKEELHMEVKKELKYKSLTDELNLLSKNFKLEVELHESEQENRKLQLWILDDKSQ